ncbi:MAG: MBL fold metallo-hydrolase [Balneolaceae bacterium]|nr:MBL fold metallo-hydrolase [Balneolaceae bacterium]
MTLHVFTVGPFAENTYLLIEEGKALIVDPGFARDSEMEPALRKLNESEAELLAVVLTHAHVDHVLGLRRVLDRYEVSVYLNDNDRYLWNHFPSQASMFGFRAEAFDVEPEPLEVQQGWEMGPFCFDVRYTPGHAPDHVSLYSEREGLVIAGDALFKNGIGRTDLYKGDMNVLTNSIREQLYTLPDETVVYPGHGPSTTIGEEKSSNPFVQG